MLPVSIAKSFGTAVLRNTSRSCFRCNGERGRTVSGICSKITNYIHNTWQFSDIVLELFLFTLNKILLSILLDPVKTKNFHVDDE